MDRLGSSGQGPGLKRVRVAGVGLGDGIEEEGHDFQESTFCPCFSYYSALLRGTHTPRFAHSAPMRVEDFFIVQFLWYASAISLVRRVDAGAPRRGPLTFFPLATYPLRIEAVKRE
jgi:hypothetical protein